MKVKRLVCKRKSRKRRPNHPPNKLVYIFTTLLKLLPPDFVSGLPNAVSLFLIQYRLKFQLALWSQYSDSLPPDALAFYMMVSTFLPWIILLYSVHISRSQQS